MCPEAPISSEKQAVEIRDWILEHEGAKLGVFVPEKSPVNCLSGRIEAEKVLLRAIVNEEPIEILGDKKTEERKLSCSYNHARELEKLGIIKFPKTQPDNSLLEKSKENNRNFGSKSV